jgi:hypothetical protein
MTDVITTEQTSTVIVATPTSATVNVEGATSAIISVDPEVTPEIPFAVNGGTLGTQPTFDGAPLFTGSYIRARNLVHFEVQIDFDNITSFGTGQYFIDLPFPSRFAYQFTAGCLHDVSTGRDYPIYGHVLGGSNRMELQSMDVTGQTVYQVDFTSTNPVALSTEDNFHLSGSYIAEEQ